MKCIWKVLTVIFIAFNLFMLFGAFNDFFEVVINNCSKTFPYMGCPWGAGSMGWPWLSKYVYSMVLFVNMIVFGMFTIIAGYKFIQKQYKKAFVISISPMPILFILASIVSLMFFKK